MPLQTDKNVSAVVALSYTCIQLYAAADSAGLWLASERSFRPSLTCASYCKVTSSFVYRAVRA
jgi:hypothetical protein